MRCISRTWNSTVEARIRRGRQPRITFVVDPATLVLRHRRPDGPRIDNSVGNVAVVSPDAVTPQGTTHRLRGSTHLDRRQRRADPGLRQHEPQGATITLTNPQRGRLWLQLPRWPQAHRQRQCTGTLVTLTGREHGCVCTAIRAESRSPATSESPSGATSTCS